jgi:hypothetical protein
MIDAAVTAYCQHIEVTDEEPDCFDGVVDLRPLYLTGFDYRRGSGQHHGGQVQWFDPDYMSRSPRVESGWRPSTDGCRTIRVMAPRPMTPAGAEHFLSALGMVEGQQNEARFCATTVAQARGHVADSVTCVISSDGCSVADSGFRTLSAVSRSRGWASFLTGSAALSEQRASPQPSTNPGAPDLRTKLNVSRHNIGGQRPCTRLGFKPFRRIGSDNRMCCQTISLGTSE